MEREGLKDRAMNKLMADDEKSSIRLKHFIKTLSKSQTDRQTLKNVTQNQAGNMMNDLKVISEWQLSQHITQARGRERHSSLSGGGRGKKTESLREL
jgi:hypothetical protein